MPVPTYDALMLPILRLCAEKAWPMRELIARVTSDLGLSEAERGALLPSGGTTVIGSRVQWAATYLVQAAILRRPRRGVVEITQRGQDVLKRNLDRIDQSILREFEGFQAFAGAKKKVSSAPAAEPVTLTTEPDGTPEEQIASASAIINKALRDGLLARLVEATPTFFERVIIDLLLAMGYGGSRADAGEQLGGTGDGGVDGVIREDQLGLDRVYLQAKRYAPGNTISSETVQAFIGALVGKGAQKGVLITTSTFSKAAHNAANQSGHLRLVLIDGDELTNLMVRFNVGVRVARTVEIKRVDLDYFGDTDPE